MGAYPTVQPVLIAILRFIIVFINSTLVTYELVPVCGFLCVDVGLQLVYDWDIQGLGPDARHDFVLLYPTLCLGGVEGPIYAVIPHSSLSHRTKAQVVRGPTGCCR